MQALSAPFIQLLVYLPEARIKCHIFPGCIFILILLKKDTLDGFENEPQSIHLLSTTIIDGQTLQLYMKT
jgi:hypothetical protein